MVFPDSCLLTPDSYLLHDVSTEVGRHFGFCLVTIPIHGNKMLRAGTQKVIMKVLGITDADL